MGNIDRTISPMHVLNPSQVLSHLIITMLFWDNIIQKHMVDGYLLVKMHHPALYTIS